MPYLKAEDRLDFVDALESVWPETPGQLNFVFTHVLQHYMEEKGISYTTLNDILGALEGCKLEAYRRVVAPYEDKKIIENGDVY